MIPKTNSGVEKPFKRLLSSGHSSFRCRKSIRITEQNVNIINPYKYVITNNVY